jgi:flagellar motor switch protein FliM
VERILSKEEIDELLSAISTGEIGTSATPALHKPDNSVTRLDLIRASMGADRWQNSNFDIVSDSFARNYGISLTNKLERYVTISRESIYSKKFDSFLKNVDNKGAIGIIRLDPLLHGGMVVCESNLAYAIVEIMLGGAPGINPLVPDRSLTTIEINIIKHVMTGVCIELQKSFEPLDNLSVSLLKMEIDPRVINFVPPDTDLMIIKFTVQIDTAAGDMFLAIPYLSLEPLREKLKNLNGHVDITNQIGKSWVSTLETDIKQIEVEVVARLEELSLPIKEILDLQEGDIIDLGRPPDAPLHVLVENRPKYFALAGNHNGKKAIRISDKIKAGE